MIEYTDDFLIIHLTRDQITSLCGENLCERTSDEINNRLIVDNRILKGAIKEHYNCHFCFKKIKEKKETVLINLYAGPGAGKSTLARGISSELSLKGYLCEYVEEVAKGWVWEERHKSFDHQIYLFGKQLRNVSRLIGKVDIIVTDSPLLFSLLYGATVCPPSFEQLVLDTIKPLNQINLFIDRVKKYEPRGRHQTKDEAIQKDKECLELLNKYKIKFAKFDGNKDGMMKALDYIDACI
jgi:hypothetical protein